MIDYKKVADSANMIINGYAFTKDGENTKVLNLNNLAMAMVLNNTGEVLEDLRPKCEANFLNICGYIGI